ncbi:hypothetical protein ACQP25_44670 (plasmid) [Microtetraspora malaysiensis]|uniref:hypothetical protein n=1 Tax=Microtetraspora malaysiensis TaxID=161358 RepID=UPI003D943B55
MNAATDVIDYNTSVDAKDLRNGMPISYDDVYSTITAHIRDDDGQRIIVQAKGDDDARTRVHIIDYGTFVDVGAVTQYGVQRPGSAHVTPVHLSHGAKARAMARNVIARYGGRLMIRQAVSDDTHLSGGMGVTDWTRVDDDQDATK